VSDYQRAKAGSSVDVPNSEQTNYFPHTRYQLEDAAWKLVKGTVLFIAPSIGFMWSLSVGFFDSERHPPDFNSPWLWTPGLL
jgi:hypothetical protein